MAVTITAQELLAALRLFDTAEETAEVERLLAYSTEAVTQHAPSATETAMNEAVRRLAAYLHDQPEAGRGIAYANAMRNSGAGRMLLPFRIHRAGYAEAIGEAQEAIGTAANPVTGLAIAGDKLVVTFADGSTDELDLPAGMGDGTDQTAMAAATAAQTAAEAATAAAGVNATAIAAITTSSGHGTYFTSSEHNIRIDSPAGAQPGDIVIQVRFGVLKVYTRLDSDSDIFWWLRRIGYGRNQRRHGRPDGARLGGGGAVRN